MAGLVLAQSCRVVWLAQEAAVPVTERGRTERRILRRPTGYGLAAQPPGLVQGSSRRITIVRFRPADIRVINRRSGLSSCHPFCDFRAGPSFVKKIPPGSTSRLTRSPHIRTCAVRSAGPHEGVSRTFHFQHTRLEQEERKERAGNWLKRNGKKIWGRL
jgi:hypothetical protein